MTLTAAGNPTIVFQSRRLVVVEDRPLPQPGPGQVRVRTHCSLISIGTELSVLDVDERNGAAWKEMQQFPFLPGYSNVGTVVETGEGVTRDWVGRRVVSWGNHGSYVTVDANRCWPVEHDVSDEDATFLVLFHVAANGLRKSQLKLGESAVVFGLGLIGQLMARLCRLAGARPVVCVDPAPERRRLAAEQQGIRTIAPHENVTAAIAGVTRGRNADVAFELTGNGDLIPSEVDVLRNEGRLILLSSPRSRTAFDFHDLCNRRSIAIIGAHNWSHPEHPGADNPWTMARHAELFFDLVADGDLCVSSLITRRAPVDDAVALYDLLLRDRGAELGVIVQFPDSGR